MSNEKPPIYGTVLLKAAKILNVISTSTEPLGLNEIAQESNITVSTTSKILDTLQLIEYVQRNPKDKKFTLGVGLIQLSNAAQMQFNIIRDSYFSLKSLYDNFHETVHLGMLRDNKILYINKFSSSENNKLMLSQIGSTRELYCSAMGKAILASFMDEKRRDYIDSAKLVPFTEFTITDKAQLNNEILTIQKLGYATDNREIEEHLFCIGASIRTRNDRSTIYAFSVTIPYYRLTDDLKNELIQSILKTKKAIEKITLSSYE